MKIIVIFELLSAFALALMSQFLDEMSHTSKRTAISKKRRRMLPPTRLEWPEDTDSINIVNQSNEMSNAGKKYQMQRKTLKHVSDSFNQNVSFGRNKLEELWIEKFAPKSIKELCIAPQRVNEVNHWLSDASICKLLVLVGSPGIGKSTMVKLLAHTRNMSVLEWNDAQTEYSSLNYSHSFGFKSQISSFQEFLDAVAFQYQSVDDGDQFNGSVVLIDELPYMHHPDKEDEFRKIFSDYIMKTQTPTVLIFSDVCEGKHKPEDLERYVENELLYSPVAKVLKINPATKSKMKSCLKEILRKEGISSFTNSDLDTYIQELHSSSEGDIRHAIMQLQFYLMGSTRKKKSIPWNSYRDTKLSTFHTLGKLLYAKRMREEDANTAKVGSDVSFYDSLWNTDHRPPLQFVPEDILKGGDIGIDGALTFLQYHSSDFYTEISELSDAFGFFSDAAYILGTHHEGREDYAISLCSRSVAHTNKHPAPSRFRQLNAPPVYDVFRKLREAQIKYDQICKRVSRFEYLLKLDINIRDKGTFASDFLPYMKFISPDDISTLLRDVYAYNDNVFTISEDKISLRYHYSTLANDAILDSDDDISSESVTNTNQKNSNVVSKIEPEIIIIDSDSE